jgi:hypothetical protein
LRNQGINTSFKNIRTGSLIIVVAACFVFACGSAGPDPSETTPPVATLYDPDSNDIIMNNDTIHFTGHISDNLQLKSMLLTIEGMQGQIYYTYNPNVEGLTSFNFDTPWLVYGIPYDTIGYLNLLVTDINDNYAYEHWYMRLRD